MIRVKASGYGLLGLFRSLDDYEAVCDDCEQVIKINRTDWFPNFQIISTNTVSVTDSFVVVCKGINGANQEIPINWNNARVQDLDGDGVDERIYTYIGQDQTTDPYGIGTYNTYYIKIQLSNGQVIRSHKISKCSISQKWNLSWFNECDGEMGVFTNFSQPFKNILRFESPFNIYPTGGEIANVQASKNGNGDSINFRNAIKTVYAFETLGNDDLFTALNHVKQFEKVQLSNDGTNEVFDLADISVSKGGQADDCVYNLTFQFTMSEAVASVCCDSLFDGSGDPCDTPTGTNCAGFGVSINPDLVNTQLTAVVSNQPSNCNTIYSWVYISGNSSVNYGSGDKVQLGGFGTYIVTAQCGQCTTTAQYYYANPCSLTVSHNISAGVINLAAANGSSAYTYQWRFSTDPLNLPGAIIPGATGPSIGIGQTGYYTYLVCDDNVANCCVQSTVYQELSQACGSLGATIARSGNVLTAGSNCGSTVPSYIWSFDDGSGKVPIGIGATTLTATANGVYYVKVICGSCSEEVHIVVLDIMPAPTHIIIDSIPPLEIAPNQCIGTKDCEPDCPNSINVGTGGSFAGC